MDPPLDNHGLLDAIAVITSRHESGRLQFTVSGSRGAFFFKEGKLVDAHMGPFSGFMAVNLAVSKGEANLKFDSSIQPPISTFFAINERILLRERFGIETIDLDPVEDPTTEIEGSKPPILFTPQVVPPEDAGRKGEKEKSFETVIGIVEEEKPGGRIGSISEEEKPSQTSGPALTLEPSIIETRESTGTKRCPKCNRVYEDFVNYCRYDSAQLVSESDTSVNASVKPEGAMRLALFWTLMTTALVVGGVFGYLLNSNIFRQPNAPGSIRLESGQNSNADEDQPVVEGPLYGKEISLMKPAYPAKAKSECISGKVTVAISVNKQGRVVWAHALTGQPVLKVAAVRAARQSKFSTEKLEGQPSKNSGTITYTFKL